MTSLRGLLDRRALEDLAAIGLDRSDEVVVDIEFGRGISTAGCLIDLGIEHNVVTKSGSFFSYGDERLGQGRNNAKAFLDENQEMAREIEGKIYTALGLDQDLVVPIERDESEPVPDLEGAEPVEPEPVGQAA